MNEDSDTPIVRRARLLSRVQNWNQDTLQHFAKDCYDHVKQSIENKDKIDKMMAERFEKTWIYKIYKHIPRQGAELSGVYEDELNWQVKRLSQYLVDPEK
jgi:hypothetical protein